MMSNDTYMFYAMQLRKHCRELGTCKVCIFNHKNSDGTIRCKLNDIPELWEIENENSRNY